MATFKAVIRKDRQKEDGTWTVYIRFTHERAVRYIPTAMSVTRRDLTAGLKFKNQQVIDRCDELIMRYRRRAVSLGLEVNSIGIDDIVRYMTAREEREGVSFTRYFEKWCAGQGIKGMRNYVTAVNALKRFFGREELTSGDITAGTLKAFELWLADRPRAVSLYTNCICRVFNDMREWFNDEENGVVRIRHSLARYHAPRQNVAEKRALSAEQVRAIYELPYLGAGRGGRVCLRDLAKDCFLLSFCLMGMNSADLYGAGELRGEGFNENCVTYFRRKTMDRRSDRARMVVRVHPVVRTLLAKYAGRERVFCFCERFSSMAGFNRALNLGLKEIGGELGIGGLQFYSARHSMATIAVNRVGIDKWTVNEMLCHTDPSMRVTDLYIEKDFGPVNEANARLLDFVFGGL